jgi:hypothetical protein
MPEPMTAGQQASLAQAQAQFEASQQRQAEQFAAQMGMSKAELGLQQQRLAAEMGRGQSPDLVSIDDPNKPGQAIYVDKRTMQPVLGPDGQPARPASQREAGASFNQANTLRTAYQKNVKDAQDSATAYRKVENAFGQDTGAGDIAGIFGFMKSIDPTSTVREGEFATAQNAGGVPASVWNLYNRAMNGERLTPEVRKQILSTAGSQVKAYLPAYEQAGKNYTELATAAGVDPTQVVQPFDFPTFDAAPAPAPPQAAPAPAPALVPQATAGQPQPVDEYSLLFGMP